MSLCSLCKINISCHFRENCKKKIHKIAFLVEYSDKTFPDIFPIVFYNSSSICFNLTDGWTSRNVGVNKEKKKERLGKRKLKR